MRFTGTRKNAKGFCVYDFSIGKEELELMTAIFNRQFEITPKLFELTMYRGRLSNIRNEFAKAMSKAVSKPMPTKRTGNIGEWIWKHLTKPYNF